MNSCSLLLQSELLLSSADLCMEQEEYSMEIHTIVDQTSQHFRHTKYDKHTLSFLHQGVTKIKCLRLLPRSHSEQTIYARNAVQSFVEVTERIANAILSHLASKTFTLLKRQNL